MFPIFVQWAPIAFDPILVSLGCQVHMDDGSGKMLRTCHLEMVDSKGLRSSAAWGTNGPWKLVILCHFNRMKAG